MDAPAAFITSLRDQNRLEAIVPCVGFDDLLDATLPLNLPHVDRLMVVTSHEDAKTVAVCQKYGAEVVQTDLFAHGGRSFTKGAALNHGFSNFRYLGWRLLLDADIALPDNFRRILLNHTHLDLACLHGADRVDLIGRTGWAGWDVARITQWGKREEVRVPIPLRGRAIQRLYGYLPLGYFQLWHATSQKDYPSTAGGAGLDDVVFAQQWPLSHRRLLPSVIVYHLCVDEPVTAENWDGVRRHRRSDGDRNSTENPA